MSPRRQITYSENPNHAARAAHARGEKAFRTYDTSYIRPKRSPIPTLIGVGALVIILGVIVWAILSFTHSCTSTPALPADQTAEITIEEGEGAKTVAKSLADAGLISDTNAFVERVNVLNAAGGHLQPGTYTIKGGTSLDEIVTILQTPVAAAVTVTVPEGSTRAQIAEAVAKASNGQISAESFLAASSDASRYAASYDFLAGAGDASLEGFLFPKTYPIDADATAESLVRAMLDQFRTETAGLDYSYPESQGLSRYDALILASIIERETDQNYRPTVASVFYNRMTEGINLQSDATTAYYIGHEPTPEDLEDDNEYNTYTQPGLPPTPICSPSLECLQAACAPETTDYLYFYIAPNEKGVVEHYFSETYEEHMASFE